MEASKSAERLYEWDMNSTNCNVSLSGDHSTDNNIFQTHVSNITRTNNTKLLGEIANSRGFKIAALNIGCLLAHTDEIRVYMNLQTIDILALNETRLDKSISNGQMYIPGYILERKDRNRNGGGVALSYIRNTINYELMHELNEDQLEWLSIKVSKPKIKYFIVGTASTLDVLSNHLWKSLKVDIFGLETNILGDFNCNVGSTPLESHTKHLLDICDLYLYHQVITECTRITN